MKIKNIYLFSCLLLSLLFVSNASAQDGKALFKQNCAACHNPIKDGTGPALKGKQAKWEKAGDDIYKWVTGSQAQIDAGVASAISASEYDGLALSTMPGQAVSKEELVSILEYVEAYEPPVKKSPVALDPSQPTNKSNNTWLMWLVIGGILSIVLVLIWGVRKQLNYANRVIAGEQNIEEETVGEEVKGFLWRNLKLVSVVGFILVCALTYYGMESVYKIGVANEGYNPDQPVAFTHKVHAGDNEIDCQYCHNSASKSKHAGIPTVNVCMNCHKAVTETTTEKGTEEIAKIHAAAGYDANTRQYTGKTEPIKWVKVHNLPDHVYFSHAQHVSIGKIECENCHGDVKTYTTGKISGVETINNLKLEGKKIIKLERPLLTMGWCVECHDKADVSTKGNKYYDDIHERLKKDKELYKSVVEDGKIKVRELGGWECSKCHY